MESCEAALNTSCKSSSCEKKTGACGSKLPVSFSLEKFENSSTEQ